MSAPAPPRLARAGHVPLSCPSMFPSRARSARTLALLVSIAVLAAITGVAGPAAAVDCFEVISGDNAQKLFEGLKAAKPGDGCALETVRTDASQMTIVWKKGGSLLEGAMVAPTSCVKVPTTRGVVLSTVVPPATAKACPASVEALATIVTGETLGKLVSVPAASVVADVEGRPLEPSLGARLRPVGLGALAAAALAGACTAIVALRRRRARRPPGPPGKLWPAIRRAGARVRSAMRARPRNGSRAGWGAAILLGPHLALGTWLLVVPDHLAFTAAQVITLAHVALALVTFPLTAGWILWHVLGMRGARARGGATSASSGVRWLLVLAAILAGATGVAALQGGTIVGTAGLHAACGVAVGVPLGLHLWQSARRRAAFAVAGLLVLATAGAGAARRWLPQAQEDATVPAFRYATRGAGLYEPAESCAECHVQDYADWKRSVHARTLEMATVRESMMRQPDLLPVNLDNIGEMLSTPDRPLNGALVFGACGSCHAPTSFYGDARPSLLRPEGASRPRAPAARSATRCARSGATAPIPPPSASPRGRSRTPTSSRACRARPSSSPRRRPCAATSSRAARAPSPVASRAGSSAGGPRCTRATTTRRSSTTRAPASPATRSGSTGPRSRT